MAAETFSGLLHYGIFTLDKDVQVINKKKWLTNFAATVPGVSHQNTKSTLVLALSVYFTEIIA